MTSSPPVDQSRGGRASSFGGRAPSFKRLPRAVREQQMLDAAVKVFSRRGYHAASMDEIAEDAGISKPMVYAYLGSKEQLFTACLHREGTRLLEAIVEAAGADGAAPGQSPQAPDPSLQRRLRQGLRAFFGFVGAHRDGWAVLYRQARGEPPFAGELAGMRARMVQVIAGLLGRALSTERTGPATGPDGRSAGGSAGGPDEIELEVLAYALVGAAESLADWLVDHPEAAPDRLADRVMAVLWHGVGRFLLTVDQLDLTADQLDGGDGRSSAEGG